jgi:hypothetical protein
MPFSDLKFISFNAPGSTPYEDFLVFEEMYGIFVPYDLKNLFVRMNKCYLKYPLVECVGMGGEVMPEGWHGLTKDGMPYLLDLYGDSIGDNVLPICDDPGGNLFVLAMRGTHQCGVYYVDVHDFEELDHDFDDGGQIPTTFRGRLRFASHWIASDLNDLADKILAYTLKNAPN